MKIVIAPDSFKECLTAREVALAIEEGLKRVFPDAEILSVPLSDGGEGLLDVVGAELQEVAIRGPSGQMHAARFGKLGSVGIIEMAEGAGIGMVPLEERDPMRLSSRGVGELIREALHIGCEELVIGLGGSGTVDGGLGALQALGFQCFTDSGEPIKEGGEGLREFVRAEGNSPEIPITLAADVTSTLEEAYLYAEQKGATKEQVQQLRQAMIAYGEKLEDGIATTAGAGAAGGMGAGFAHFLGARLCRGFDVVADMVGLDQAIQEADLVITAEGSVNHLSYRGKVPAGVAERAKGKPVVLLGGALQNEWQKMHTHGIDAIWSTTQRPASLATCLENASLWLIEAAEELGRTIQIGRLL